MSTRKTLLLIGASAAALFGGTCAAGSPDTTTVSVSILPQRQFVQRIAGDLVQVEVLVLPGHSPATYEPTPRQMTRLAESDLWIRIGVPFEEHVMNVVEGLKAVRGELGL